MLPDLINKLVTDGVKVEVAFEEKTIFKFLLWGALAAIVAGVVTALLKKALA